MNRPYEGRSASVSWKVEEIRAAESADGREVRWDYSLALTETRGVGIRFETIETGGDLAYESERIDRLLPPRGVLRVARSARRVLRDGVPAGFGAAAGPGTVSVFHRLRGTDDRGEPVEVHVTLPLSPSIASGPEPQTVRPAPEGELTRAVRTMRRRIGDWIRPDAADPGEPAESGGEPPAVRGGKEATGETVAGEPPYAGEVLTNDSIVALVRAGLSEGVVLAKIRATPNRFDVTTDALVQLKRQGLPERIIEAMVSARSGGPGSAMPPAEPSAARPPAPALAPPPLTPLGPLGPPGVAARPPAADSVPAQSQAVHHVSASRRVPLRQARGKLEFTHQVFAAKVELVVSGRTARYRIKERRPVFHTFYPHPEHIQLGRLRIGGNDDRNLKLLSRHAFQFQMNVGFSVDEDDEVRLEVEPDPQGGHRLRPEKPLEPGEYGFVGAPWGAGGITGFVNVPEFGVD